MIKFREKNFGVINSPILQSVIKGATLGATATSGLGLIFKDQASEFTGLKDNAQRNLVVFGAGTLLGAGLGLVAGLVKSANTSINRARTVDARLMQTVIENLKKSGLKEGRDFTRDPKVANDLKTKVCIVITKVSNDLKLLINAAADPKLLQVSNGMLRNLPNSSAVRKNMSDKFNNIEITTISDSSADSGLVTGIAEYFIHNGFPVYLVEVG